MKKFLKLAVVALLFIIVVLISGNKFIFPRGELLAEGELYRELFFSKKEDKVIYIVIPDPRYGAIADQYLADYEFHIIEKLPSDPLYTYAGPARQKLSEDYLVRESDYGEKCYKNVDGSMCVEERVRFVIIEDPFFHELYLHKGSDVKLIYRGAANPQVSWSRDNHVYVILDHHRDDFKRSVRRVY